MTEPREPDTTDGAQLDETSGEVIEWGRLAPYVSLRFFQLDDPGELWTADSYRRAAELALLLPTAVALYPPTSRPRTAGGRIAHPPGVVPINAGFFDVASGDLKTHFNLDPAADPTAMSAYLQPHHIFMVGAWYRISAPPPWLQRDAGAGGSNIADIQHHLVLVAMLPPYVALTSTQSPVQDMLDAFLADGQLESLSLSAPLTRVPDPVLEAAFVNGEAYHLWLSGLHRSVVTKPDRKNLAGLDLRHALDPYAEQTYTYRAVVSRLAEVKSETPHNTPRVSAKRGPPSVGFSRTTGTVWTSKAPGLMEFATRISALRKLLRGADPRISKPTPAIDKIRREARMGLNYLSRPTSAAEIEQAREPFEVHLDVGDPEPSGEAPTTELGQDREEWRTRGLLELAFDDPEMAPQSPDNSLLPIKAYFNREPIARLWLRVSPADDERVGVKLMRMTPAGAHGTESYLHYESLGRLIEQPGRNRFTVRYQSGHVLEGEQLYRPEYQDVLFKDWTPVSLTGIKGRGPFDPTKEKPGKWSNGTWSEIRQDLRSGDSLFARVACEPSRLLNTAKDVEWYLLCHDQANEVADFVYIEPQGRRIALIHVKGAHAHSQQRKVSIDAYQVVVAQAIKNLRHLDKDVLYHRLVSSSGASSRGGAPGVFAVSGPAPGSVSRNTSGFMSALARLRDGLPVIHKQVVVFQPHIRQSYWQQLRDHFEGSPAPRNDTILRPAFMLSSLLIEAEIACRKQGVEFEVWCDAS